MNLYRNQKYKKDASISVLLWFLILGMVTRVTVFLRQRDIESIGSIDNYAVLQIALVLIITSIVLFNYRRISGIFKRSYDNSIVYLLVYYIFCGISAIWSSYPMYSAYRALEFFIVILAVLICIKQHDEIESAEKKVLLISSLVILLTVLGQIKLSGFSLSLWHWHTNSYSASSAMVFCYCAGEYFNADKKRKNILFYYGFFGLVWLTIGTSAASNLSAAFGIFIILVLYNRAALGIMFLVFIVLLFILIRPIQGELSFIYPILFPGKTPMEIESLGGRLYLWQYALMIFKMKPLFGHGFGVVSSNTENLIASHLHNSIAAALVGTGVFGTLFFILYLIRLGVEIVASTFRKLPGAVGCAGALLAGTLNSLAMPLIGDKWEESSVVFLSFNVLLVLFVIVPHKSTKKKSVKKVPLQYSKQY